MITKNYVSIKNDMAKIILSSVWRLTIVKKVVELY